MPPPKVTNQPSHTVRMERAVRSALERHERVVLAVSGGVDSMVLLKAAVRTVPERIALVATFDHGTGSYARAAAELVVRSCEELGVSVLVGRGPAHDVRAGMPAEATLREERWRFLRVAARALEDGGALIATAHTRDDQVETVVMRIMRGAGSRGLAGLYANSELLRPLLDISRSEVESYAAEHGVEYLEDPSNLSRRYFRNRVRLDILPALRRVRPGICDEMLESARQAAEWRAQVEELAGAVRMGVNREGYVCVDASDLARFDRQGLQVLIPAVAARAGITLDRRGTTRLAEFITGRSMKGRVQLSGGHEVVRTNDSFYFRPLDARRNHQGAAELGKETVWGSWRFSQSSEIGGRNTWHAWLPAGRTISVRSWKPGDRMVAAGSSSPRRVKRFLSDAGVTGTDRDGWPVVLVGSEIVWIPGVRHGSPPEQQHGKPGTLYVCERTGGRSET